MRLRIALFACACLIAALCAGCSRPEEASSQEEGPAIEPGPASTVKTEPASRPAPAAGERVQEATRVADPGPGAAEDAPFRVCALLNPRNGVARCGVIQKGAGFSSVLKIGDSYAGYRLAKVDYEGESAVFEKGAAKVTLHLTRGEKTAATKPKVAPPFQQAGVQPSASKGSFKNIDLTKVKPQYFEPEEWETKVGIDPNDPKTWPEGYRGPAIERLIRKHPPKKDQVNLPLESARKAGKLKSE